MTGLDLKLARVRLGLTQFALALKLGLHPSRLSEMETDKRRVTEEVAYALRELLSGLEASPR